MDCEYKEVDDCNHKRNAKSSRIIFLRQFLVSSGVWTSYFVFGLCVGAPTVFIPQIRRDANATEAVSEDMESWLSSILGYAGLPWVFVVPVFTQQFGRKLSFIVLCATSLLGFIIFYCSTNTTQLLIAQLIQGLPQTAVHSILPVIIAEYTSLKHRSIFLTFKSASLYWGIWVSNAIGTFFHWKNIGIFSFICSVYTATAFIWPESPYWLATKGRFDECTESYRWLKGIDSESEEELKYLIKSQKDYLESQDTKKRNIFSNLKNFKRTTLSKEFYKPMLLCMLMMALCHLSGKLAFSIYAIKVIKKITDNESRAYRGMLILDGVTVFGMYGGCFLASYLKRRTQLIGASSLGVLFLFMTSVYLYLIKLSILSENYIVSIFLLISFSISISCGPIIMGTSIYGELIPLRFKSSGMFFMAFFTNSVQASVLKVSPYLFRSFGLHGACLFYGISASVCILLLYLYLPETKNKSLEVIENYFKDYAEEDGTKLMNINGKKSKKNTIELNNQKPITSPIEVN